MYSLRVLEMDCVGVWEDKQNTALELETGTNCDDNETSYPTLEIKNI